MAIWFLSFWSGRLMLPGRLDTPLGAAETHSYIAYSARSDL